MNVALPTKAVATAKGAEVRYSIETVFEVTDESGRKYVIKFFPLNFWFLYRIDEAGNLGELEDAGALLTSSENHARWARRNGCHFRDVTKMVLTRGRHDDDQSC